MVLKKLKSRYSGRDGDVPLSPSLQYFGLDVPVEAGKADG